uniref:Protein kinase domain-containing protein n=1 Tax=Caenorhabditis japonica TaxID=281687 RepID=A0A8R1IB51_CAEJA
MAEKSAQANSEDINISNGDVINGYEVLEKIDEGNFGQVFKVKLGKKRYAMKVEPNPSDESQPALQFEMEIVLDLQRNGVNYSPKFVSGGKEPKFYMLVMELLGENLKKLRQKSSTSSPSTWGRVGIQCLYVIKEMHDIGYVHRDLKPGNFALGPVDNGLNSRVLFVLDFGISQKFIRKRNGEVEFKSTNKTSKSLKGTPIYASLNAHARAELGRCDDLSSLLYMMAEFVKPLPWETIEDLEDISKSKASQKLKDLFKNDAFDAVETMIKNCTAFSFPDYELVYTAFRGVFEKSGGQWIDPYDWESAQNPVYKRWRELAEKQKFAWESHDDMLNFLRKDPFDSLKNRDRTMTTTMKDDTRKKKAKKSKSKKKSDTAGEPMPSSDDLQVVRKFSKIMKSKTKVTK